MVLSEPEVSLARISHRTKVPNPFLMHNAGYTIQDTG